MGRVSHGTWDIARFKDAAVTWVTKLAQLTGCGCRALGYRGDLAPEKQDEAIKVFIVKNDLTLTEDGVNAYCKPHLTGYKRPKYIEFRDDLPKTNVGNIIRRELRASA